MFLRSLKIENDDGIVRLIKFRAGVNLIVDETPTGTKEATGNNVGKTTVLRLIDFSLGGKAKDVYTDPENRKVEHLEVKDFLINTRVVVTLKLCRDLNAPTSDDMTIERNFISRGKDSIRKVNGKQLTEDGFDEVLTNSLVPGHYGKKPTFAQIISHNIRYKDLSVSQTLRTLNQYTRDDEYESLHLFLLGCNTDKGAVKQSLLAKLRVEDSFKQRLEATQTKSAYKASLAHKHLEIAAIEREMDAYKARVGIDQSVSDLAEVRHRIALTSSKISRLKLRRDLANEAVTEIRAKSVSVDVKQLQAVYDEVTDRIGELGKSFSQLLAFHNSMIAEKARYIEKDIPSLTEQIEALDLDLSQLTDREREISETINGGTNVQDLGALVSRLSDAQRARGEFETIVSQIDAVDKLIEGIRKQLGDIEKEQFSDVFAHQITAQIDKFNTYFAQISKALYGETYLLKFDTVTGTNGQSLYKFSSFNANFSSGKKQGEIVCFDIAYNLFADNEGIPCYHFLLNDKKELMHDNQLAKIGMLIEEKSAHVQLLASILRDKLPEELNREELIVLKLSQEDKLFRIESR